MIVLGRGRSWGGGNLVLVSVSGAKNTVWFRGLAENQMTNGANAVGCAPLKTPHPCLMLQTVELCGDVSFDFASGLSHGAEP